ncbi:hypothetical protein LHYA1_G003156 [Lachnellula hyalina]|uniref:Uncharacterized protein n=1 Tax=Lachnellula hyalina TaxID=1316788 RepID=A0A8H8R295_9HELO|nr:uncharacterized protein LHYA1_G003156 [Lachnellula hyalina]TVY27089.1 hypothetical protein LHYA1_G003156 [Lachnellula hyalina]
MSRRDVRTRDTENSIWLDLTENVFRQHLVALEERTNAVPLEPQVFTAAEWHPPSPNKSKTQYTLPLAVEQQVADEFACLVAVEEGAQSVAAICMEEHPQAPRLTLRFAAMDVSFNDTVQRALEEWSVILSRAAAGNGPPLFDPVEAMFHGVIRLHFRRLLARLRSSKWNKPKYLSKSHKKPLWQDMEGLIHRAQFVYTKKERVTRVLVEKFLGDLAAVYEAFEHALGNELTEIEQVVLRSLEFCSTAEIKDYLLRLESSVGAKPTNQMASALKTLRQIQKIASYRRMSMSLVKIAKEYPNLFEGGITLAYLTPYQSVPTTIGYEEWATTCHVHAEVQLAVHYDLISQQKREMFLKPRAIGVSKSLCYLCYRFLLAHHGFFPSRTHGRLYDQWTLPDLSEFDEDTEKRYRNILKDIDEEVGRHTENEPELWRIEPMTSIDVYYIQHQN